MDTPSPFILLVDDDPDFLELYKRILERGGLEAHCFSDPEDALESMRIEVPSLVITDLMMDSLDSGFTLSRAIKTDPRLKHLPVVVITAAAKKLGFDFSPRDEKELSAMNADAYFDKPVDGSKLLKKVFELLSRTQGASNGS